MERIKRTLELNDQEYNLIMKLREIAFGHIYFETFIQENRIVWLDIIREKERIKIE